MNRQGAAQSTALFLCSETERGKARTAQASGVRVTAADVVARVRALGCPEQAAILARFFKTGPGQYGAGDRFVGVKVPVLRKLTKQFQGLPLCEVERLLHSELHEARLVALLILVLQFLDRHQRSMPRTILRYAIERFPEKKRLQYLRASRS